MFLGLDLGLYIYLFKQMGGLTSLAIIVFIMSVGNLMSDYQQNYLISWSEIFQKDNKTRQFGIYFLVQLIGPIVDQASSYFSEDLKSVAISNLRAKLQFKLIHGQMQQFLDKIQRAEISNLVGHKGEQIFWSLSNIQYAINDLVMLFSGVYIIRQFFSLRTVLMILLGCSILFVQSSKFSRMRLNWDNYLKILKNDRMEIYLDSSSSIVGIRALGMSNFAKLTRKKQNDQDMTNRTINTSFWNFGENFQTVIASIFVLLPLYLDFWQALKRTNVIVGLSVFLLSVSKLEDRLFYFIYRLNDLK